MSTSSSEEEEKINYRDLDGEDLWEMYEAFEDAYKQGLIDSDGNEIEQDSWAELTPRTSSDDTEPPYTSKRNRA